MSAVSRVESITNSGGKILTISPDDSIKSAVRKMTSNRIGCLLVIDKQGKIVGILTERDIVKKVIDKSVEPERNQVSLAMTRKVLACTMSTPLTQAQQTMANRGIRHMPILENGKPIGMISSRDILSHQLATVRAVACKQSELLNNLEAAHPGISRLEHDHGGRIVI